MNRKNFLKLSLVSFIISLVLLAISYYFFHYVTDSGFTLTWHPEAGKPFVTDMLGQFSVLFLWTSAVSLLIAFIFFKKEETVTKTKEIEEKVGESV